MLGPQSQALKVFIFSIGKGHIPSPSKLPERGYAPWPWGILSFATYRNPCNKNNDSKSISIWAGQSFQSLPHTSLLSFQKGKGHLSDMNTFPNGQSHSAIKNICMGVVFSYDSSFLTSRNNALAQTGRHLA